VAASGEEGSSTVAVAAGAAGTPGTSSTGATEGATLADSFVDIARSQAGDDYVFGAEAGLDDADPDAFDCSELTQWAADQVGVTIPDGAMYQYLELKDQGQLMSVEEALRTKGALLFYFSEEPTPGGSRPGSAHVAISLGDGRTIEARGSSYGVNEFSGTGRFNYAGVIPEMAGSAPMTEVSAMAEPDVASATEVDTDDDQLSDELERLLGLDPSSADSDADGTSDTEEYLGAPDLLSGTEVRAALAAQGLEGSADADFDGLSNRYEIRHGYDALQADIDHDGINDGNEVGVGSDPLKLDSDSDGLSDKLELDLGLDPVTAGSPTDGWGLAEDDELTGPGTLGEPVGSVDDAGEL
jgi:cell wall-associated NlpC family hydrolase